MEEAPESIAPPTSGKTCIRFEAPDPRGLSINGKPLREHLQQAGLTMPLKLRPLLQSLSFADFEARYTGRADVRRMRRGRWSASFCMGFCRG